MITKETIEKIEAEKSDKYLTLLCPISLEVIQEPCVKIQQRFYTLSHILTALTDQRKKYFDQVDFGDFFELRLPTGENFPEYLLDLMTDSENRSMKAITLLLTTLSVESQKEYAQLLENAAREVNGEPVVQPQPVLNQATRVPISRPVPRTRPARRPPQPVEPSHAVHARIPIVQRSEPEPEPITNIEPQRKLSILREVNVSRLFSIAFGIAGAFVLFGGLEKLAAASDAAASLLALGNLAAVCIIGSTLWISLFLLSATSLTITNYAKKTSQNVMTKEPNNSSDYCLITNMRNMRANQPTIAPVNVEQAEIKPEPIIETFAKSAEPAPTQAYSHALRI